ncbi:Predicted arabinose efflux permease, MFS family [Desulfacinum infernum DSM 9756]|uniref:Predicted arabinose efflux permease, MFS family n=1 Tax=Desulfacinum infernum DSM 9756 TaxID=1121391 RepID=A0A1M5G6Z2_9BACT|nr:MFS transporter [Desulfacinum infernum]SHF99489.1 Predicted arabinose efflux permease, MFS family [Desulfacinum infernum DSM 9756]
MGKKWAVMWTVYLASVVVVINQFKVPPVMATLMKDLQVSMGAAGWLMSIFAFAGIVLALPAAVILGRFGPRLSGLMGLGFTVLGSVVGALASTSTMLLAGRLIEGVGLGLISVVAPAVIAMWFRPEEMGLPMGIWSTWVPVGSTLAYNLAGPIQESMGWQGIWWAGAGVAVVTAVIYGLVVTKPGAKSDGSVPESHTGAKCSYADGFRTPAIWYLAMGFVALMFCAIGYTTWSPIFYREVFQLEPGKANFYTSLVFIMNIPGALLCGWLLTKVNNQRALLAAAIFISTLLYPLGFALSSASMIVPYVCAIGLVPVFIATASFTLAPEVMPSPELGGLAMGILTIGQNVGTLIGPPLIGRVVSGGNWAAGNYPMLAIMLVTSVCAVLLVLDGKKAKRVVAPAGKL